MTAGSSPLSVSARATTITSHSFSYDYRNGPRWYNFDPSKWLIYLLSLAGLAYNLQRQKA